MKTLRLHAWLPLFALAVGEAALADGTHSLSGSNSNTITRLPEVVVTPPPRPPSPA